MIALVFYTTILKRNGFVKMENVAIRNQLPMISDVKGFVGFVKSTLKTTMPRSPIILKMNEEQSFVIKSVLTLTKSLSLPNKKGTSRRKKAMLLEAFSGWPREWEGGFVILRNYDGDNPDLDYACKLGTVFRVIEVRNNKKSGRCTEEKRRQIKDTLFIEPEDGSGMFKLYAGEAWVELIKHEDYL